MYTIREDSKTRITPPTYVSIHLIYFIDYYTFKISTHYAFIFGERCNKKSSILSISHLILSQFRPSFLTVFSLGDNRCMCKNWRQNICYFFSYPLHRLTLTHTNIHKPCWLLHNLAVVIKRHEKNEYTPIGCFFHPFQHNLAAWNHINFINMSKVQSALNSGPEYTYAIAT